MLSLVNKNRARLPRGFMDRTADDLWIQEKIMATVRNVYELYGFDPIETPLIEYADALGKFLPDQDRQNSGIFSLQDEDKQWLSLRYDLTAPLARYVAENFECLLKPFRSYRAGWVFRNEKPGPGRFRQFLQFDADTVGTGNICADVEMCIIVAKTLEQLGIRRKDYVIRVNNRKILDGVMEKIHLSGENQQVVRLSVLRAIDKLDKFSIQDIALLLGEGRLDESGDFTKGAGLNAAAIDYVLHFISSISSDPATTFINLRKAVDGSAHGLAGVIELEEMHALFSSANYEDCIKIDPSVVRGLEYYTGPVFEAVLLSDITNNEGKKVVFGSIGGGGRYDSLVSRFHSFPIPATGFSIGVSRLVSALRTLENPPKKKGPVVVLTVDQRSEAMSHYRRIVDNLHEAGIRAEVYAGSSNMKVQMKYADRRNAPCVIIQGSLEREAGIVKIKDLIEGSRLSTRITDNKQWREQSPAQITVQESQVVEKVKHILSLHSRIPGRKM